MQQPTVHTSLATGAMSSGVA